MMTNGSYGNSLNDISTFGGSMSQITCIISFSTLVFLKLQSWCHHIDTLQQSYVAYAPRCVIDNSGWYNIRRLEYSFSAPQYLLNWERCSPNSICWGGWLSTFTSRSNFLSPFRQKGVDYHLTSARLDAWQLCRLSRQSELDLLLKDAWCDPTVINSTR